MKETTIKLDKSYRDFLREQGMKGEDYQDVIKRLINSPIITEEPRVDSKESPEALKLELKELEGRA